MLKLIMKNNMNKCLSIIIPTYNMEKYLRKCLDSLCLSSDNFGQLEVLVVNDGSKDSSSDIAHEYEAKYADVFRVIDKENGNYGSCVNRGLQEATGKYIKVLDADDSFDKSSLSVFIDYLDSHDADLFITDFQMVSEDDAVINKHIHQFPADEKLSWNEYYNSDEFKYLQMHAVTYKRQNLLDIKYHQTEGISYTDAQWVFLPMSTVQSFYYCPVTLYHYLIGREGQTMDARVYLKNIGQLITMTLDRVSMFEAHHLQGTECEAYYTSKLVVNLKFIYRCALVVNPHLIPEVTKFDLELKQRSPYIFSFTNSVVLFDKFPFKIVDYWRKHDYKPLPFYMFYFFKCLYTISKKRI